MDIANSKLTKLDGETLDTLVNVYNEELTKLMDKHAPVTTERVKKQRKEPWHNDDVSFACKTMRTSEG